MILDRIKQAGQSYLDEPQYLTIRAKPIAVGVCKAVKHPVPQDIRELTHYERIKLNWINPKRPSTIPLSANPTK